jgi:hypothetical protein
MANFIPTYGNSNNSTLANNDDIYVPEFTVSSPQPFQYSKIFDLRDASVFEMDIEYMSPYEFSHVLSYFGNLSLSVVDPLIVNGEAAATVDYLVEVKAKPGFQFGLPAAPNFNVQLLNTGVTPLFQSGGRVAQDEPDNTLQGVGAVKDTSAHTIGEKFMSVKQLMMMPNYYPLDVANASVATGDIPMWWYSPRISPTIPQTTTTTWLSTNRAGLIASLYAFVNGGSYVSITTDTPDDRVSVAVASYPWDWSSAGTTPSYSVLYGGNTAARVQTITQFKAGMYYLPSYTTVVRPDRSAVINSAIAGNRNAGLGTTNYIPVSSYVHVNYRAEIRNTSGSTRRPIWGISAADDARCAGWLGCPPIILYSNTSTAPLDVVGTY